MSRQWIWVGFMLVVGFIFWVLARPSDVAWSLSAVRWENADRIRPYEKNPWYWQYQGKPALLLGGAKMTTCFRFRWARSYLAKQPRPINTVKTYGADGGRYGTSRDGVERWWRHLMGGVAAVRFHRRDSGLGLSTPAIASIRAERKLESLIKPWDVEPANHLLNERVDNEAYLSARPAHAYALYFPDGGEVGLDLKGAKGRFEVRWIDIRASEWGKRETINGGDIVTIRTPGKGGWAAAILKTNA